MTNATVSILADRRNVTVDTRWNGHCRVWTVRDADGMYLFSTDDYTLLLRRLEDDELRAGSYPPNWWPRA